MSKKGYFLVNHSDRYLTMVRFMDRPLGYRVGLGLLALGWLLFLIGYAVPAWHSQKFRDDYNDGYSQDEDKETVYFSGLWLRCKEGISDDCDYLEGVQGWLHAVRFLVSLTFILLGISLVLAAWLNFSPAANRHELDNKSIEACGFIGGTLGIIAIIVYAAIVKNSTGNNHIGWAFAINCIGSLFALGGSLMVAVLHGKPNEAAKTGSVHYGMGTGLDASFQQETQIGGFPEIDNPGFTDPTQIRFVRSTRPSSSSNNDHSPAPATPHQPSYDPPHPGQDTNRRHKQYLNDSVNTSSGQLSITDEPPPSYQSVISQDSTRDRDLGDGHSGSYSGFQSPRMLSNYEVEL